jgi:hypothetical protein
LYKVQRLPVGTPRERKTNPHIVWMLRTAAFLMRRLDAGMMLFRTELGRATTSRVGIVYHKEFMFGFWGEKRAGRRSMNVDGFGMAGWGRTVCIRN